MVQFQKFLLLFVLCLTVMSLVSSYKISRSDENSFHETMKLQQNKTISNIEKREKDTSKTRFHPHIRLGRRIRKKT